MQKDTSERVVLLFDPERNELKNSFTKKKFTDVAKLLLITDMSVGPKFYWLPIFVPNSYWLLILWPNFYWLPTFGPIFNDYWFLMYPIETLMTANLILWAAPYSHINIKKLPHMNVYLNWPSDFQEQYFHRVKLDQRLGQCKLNPCGTLRELCWLKNGVRTMTTDIRGSQKLILSPWHRWAKIKGCWLLKTTIYCDLTTIHLELLL